ncbi:MAG: glycosyltransferase, partial [Candidatus Paceibacterota bacterium]
MRIAIFVDSFYPVLGGMEDATATLAKSLGEAGYEVDLYVPSFSRRNYLGRALPVGDLNLGPKVKIYHLFSLPLPYWLFAARLIVPTLGGYRFFKKNRPDLIHVQSMWGAGLEALWASSLLKIPLVGTNHAIISEFGAYFPFAKKTFIKIMV